MSPVLRAFTSTLREIVGRRASQQVKYFNGYQEAQRDDVDVMICDEAHRIRITSNQRFTPAARRSKKPQIDELLHASKVGVFFVDDRQVVKPDEIGSSIYIKDAAIAAGVNIQEFELEAQFRCGGNAGFINWVNNTLELERTANVLFNDADEYEFRIASCPQELEGWIRMRSSEGKNGESNGGILLAMVETAARWQFGRRCNDRRFRASRGTPAQKPADSLTESRPLHCGPMRPRALSR